MIDWFPWRRFAVKSFVSGRLWLWDWFDTYKICWILSVIPDFERGMRPHAGADHKTSNLWHQNKEVLAKNVPYACEAPKINFDRIFHTKAKTRSKLILEASIGQDPCDRDSKTCTLNMRLIWVWWFQNLHHTQTLLPYVSFCKGPNFEAQLAPFCIDPKIKLKSSHFSPRLLCQPLVQRMPHASHFRSSSAQLARFALWNLQTGAIPSFARQGSQMSFSQTKWVEKERHWTLSHQRSQKIEWLLTINFNTPSISVASSGSSRSRPKLME